MAWAKGVAILVIVVMFGFGLNILINDGFNHGVGMDTFLQGLANPWQALINHDLMSGLIMMITWIIYRGMGGRVLNLVTWVWLVLWWGNIVVAAYVLVATYQSKGDAARFFMGARAGTLRRVWDAPSVWLRALCGIGAIATTVFLAIALQSSGLAGIAVFGYIAGFAPIALALAALATSPSSWRITG